MITSTSNRQVIYACSLKEKKYRDREKKFLIEGEHLLQMADQIECIFTTDESFTHASAPVILVSPSVLEKISFTKSPQGLVGIVRKKEFLFNDLATRYLLLDNVSDPGNVGTIIRTALAFHIDQVILSPGSVDIYNDKVIRSSQGALFQVDVGYADLSQVIGQLKKNQVSVYASTLADGSIDLKKVQPAKKFALIVGNEGAGISQKIVKESNFCIKIMHSDRIDSLNVGVATSIMLYYFDDFLQKN